MLASAARYAASASVAPTETIERLSELQLRARDDAAGRGGLHLDNRPQVRKG